MEQSEEITLAKQLFNQCWDLIEKADRSAEEDLAMLHMAHYVVGNLAEANRYKSQAIAAFEGVGEEDAKHIRDQINELPF
jgi:hypothetical protein